MLRRRYNFILADAPFAADGMGRELLAEIKTVVTRAFTGRPARALPNTFLTKHTAHAPLGYPAVHHLTQAMRRAAAGWSAAASSSATSLPLEKESCVSSTTRTPESRAASPNLRKFSTARAKASVRGIPSSSAPPKMRT